MTAGSAEQPDDGDTPIAHHYAFVLIVQALTLLALWLAPNLFR